MAFFDFLTGTKRPAANVAAISKSALRDKILALNDDKKPFRVLDGSAEGADLIMEWKIVDAEWYETFAKAGLTQVFKIYINLDEEKHELRPLDKEYSVAWTAGVPTLSIAASAFRGQKSEISFGGTYGMKADGSFGKIYEYQFNTEEMKQPLREVTLASGWIYKPRTV